MILTSLKELEYILNRAWRNVKSEAIFQPNFEVLLSSVTYLLYFSAHPTGGFAHIVFTSLFNLMLFFANFSSVETSNDVILFDDICPSFRWYLSLSFFFYKKNFFQWSFSQAIMGAPRIGCAVCGWVQISGYGQRLKTIFIWP